MAENEAPQGAEVAETSQNEVVEGAGPDWKAESRKWEARAKENLAAAKANEEAAKRLAEIEESQKTEAQKQQEALEKAQAELAELRVAKTRAEVAATKGVPVELLNGSTQEELEASADAIIAFKGEQPPNPFPKADPSQGVHNSISGGTNAERFASFMAQRI